MNIPIGQSIPCVPVLAPPYSTGGWRGQRELPAPLKQTTRRSGPSAKEAATTQPGR
jgi:hypothetical protein